MGVHVLDIGLAGLALYLIGRLIWRSASLPLPPGPPAWPLIGNLLNFPMHAPYKTFGDMGNKYGPIISLRVMGTRYVVLNSLKATNDLLEKKSAITSNRPHFTMGGDLVGWGNSTPFLPYGDTFRKHRKFLHQQIGTKSSLEAFYLAEEEEAKQFVRNVMKNPDDLVAHSRRTAASVILKISHGYSVKEDGDPLVEMADKAMHIFSIITTPGRFLVDMLPILRYVPEWFPGGGFHKDAKRWRKMVSETANTPHRFVLEHLAKGDVAPSFTSRLLQECVAPEDEDIIKRAAFSMYLGGSDTTPSTLSAFFLAMTLYPEVFRKAQVEIDAVVGYERLPTIGDRDELPYVNAICKELLRWNAVSPLAMHVTIQDEIYDGYFIPKGTCLLGNIWFILNDPQIYPDPDVFNPERFLGENQQLDPRRACFGWGRRSCPGAHLAQLSIFICVATALATLDVSRYVENGVELVPRYDVEEGIVRHVKPFKCVIVSRSKKAEDLLST
ncbi:cytochrome P450 [Boletus edulis BED1]|uniref:Cytochrome P450 n=1 Tax=Boletus edulis BED1 TaxID=1328754 RepID=A0AAD4C0M4_BOLED|nr:cytochrome P450 [Boletus edulis BED1]